MASKKRTPKRAPQRAIYGQGSVRFDPARGLFIGTFELERDANGKRQRKRVAAKDREECLAKLRAAQTAQDQGLPAPSGQLTTIEWLDHWVAHIAPTTAKKSHHIYAAAIDDWIRPHIGRTPLVKFQPEHFDQLMGKLEARGLSAGSRAKVRTVMHRAFFVAMQRGKLNRNVIALVDPLELEHHTSDAMTPAQVEQILNHALIAGPAGADGLPTPDRFHALAVLVLVLGLRQGEALNARWSHIDDLDGAQPVLHIPAAKSRAGVRDLPLPTMVVVALRAHRARQRAERMASDVWGDPDLIFTTTIGTRIDRRNALRWWHGLTESANVGRRRFHSTRHTAATIMLNAGVPLEQVSKILGHSRLAITSDIYAKPSAESLRTSVDQVDAMYAARASSKPAKRRKRG